MTVNLEYRRATIEDLRFLLDLRKVTMTKHLVNMGLLLTEKQNLDEVKSFFNDNQIILSNHKPIGVLKLAKFKHCLHIRQFQILPAMQNKGIGGTVINAVIKRAKQLNLPITLNVLLENEAHNLYFRYGFVTTGQNELEYNMCYQVNH